MGIIKVDYGEIGGGGETGYIDMPYNTEISLEIENGTFTVNLNGGQTVGGYGNIINGVLDTSVSYTNFTYCTINYSNGVLKAKMTYNYGNAMKLIYAKY